MRPMCSTRVTQNVKISVKIAESGDKNSYNY